MKKAWIGGEGGRDFLELGEAPMGRLCSEV